MSHTTIFLPHAGDTFVVKLVLEQTVDKLALKSNSEGLQDFLFHCLSEEKAGKERGYHSHFYAVSGAASKD
jgi:hypothetical protein